MKPSPASPLMTRQMMEANQAAEFRAIRQVLPMSAVIPPGERRTVTTKPGSAFRPERLVISPHSFPLTRLRKAWTAPLVVVGSWLGRAHRALARLARVDLHAPREHIEYVDDEHEPEPESAERVDFEAEHLYDADEDRYYQAIPIPFSRRERLLLPIGRAARRLAGVRMRWQEAQLATLRIYNITISRQSHTLDLTGDIFAANAFDAALELGACTEGHEIAIAIENGNRRECRLVMAMIGTGVAA